MPIAPTLQKHLAAENIQYEVIPHELGMTSTRAAEACHISDDRPGCRFAHPGYANSEFRSGRV